MSGKTFLRCETSSLLNPNNRLHAQFLQQPFNYKVSVLLPDCAQSQLEATLRTFQSFYLIHNLPLYELLDKGLHQGSVCGLSYKTRIDEDNCAFLESNGRLSLSLDKDSYELFGVEGKACKANSGRYVVTVDLTDVSMAPGGWGYKRLLSGLTSRLPLKMDFLLATPSGNSDQLQSLLLQYDWSQHTPDVVSRLLNDLTLPSLLTSDLRSHDPFDFLEWLGAVQADICQNNASDDFLSTLAYLHPVCASMPSSLLLSARGLLLPENVETIVQQLRRIFEEPHSPPWAAVTVYGFADSLDPCQRHFYTLLLFPDHAYSLYLATPAS
ncbi:ribonuclease P protein subunit p40 [Corythoichthys intestinalis]|uniref:ribonuclease P protein subunit p40 n=1 Tax=Corythoichthys intestinalis TaxID=161448 RepID=UPI0025A56C2E|nr:ribonuclease P protein subunit p40 [Corythoichthys intestinalis]